MRIVIPDDCQDAVRQLDAFARLAGHAVTVYRDTVTDLDTLAERFADALEAALRAYHPGMAAVDVFAEEPLIARPLLELPNLLATPHLGYVEKDSYACYFSDAFDKLLAFIDDRPVTDLAAG